MGRIEKGTTATPTQKTSTLLLRNEEQVLLLRNKKWIAISGIVLAFTGFILGPTMIGADERPRFLSGNIMTANNLTSGDTQFRDPVNAKPGEPIGFQVVAQNQVPNTIARNVKISANCPGDRLLRPKASAQITANNANTVSDTATVVVTDSTRQGLAYIPGHVWVFSKSCPNGCSGSDVISSGGLGVGNIEPGEGVRVTFKCGVTNFVQPTPTVTPTPTEVVTPTPTPSQENVIQCPEGFIKTISGSNIICIQQVQSQSQTQNVTQEVNASGGSATTGDVLVNVTSAGGSPASTTVVQPLVLGTTTPSVSELPKTGLPLAAWALSGLLPAGIGIRRFTRGEKGIKEGANYIWQRREFSK